MAAPSRPRSLARPRRRRGPSIVAARSCPMGRTPSNASSAERASRSAASAPVASHSRDHVRRVPPRAAGHDQPELWHGRRYVRRSRGAGSGRLEDGDHRCVVAGPPRAVIHDRPARGDPQPPVHDYVVVLPWLRAVTVRVGAHVSAAGRVRADAVRGGHLVWRDRPRVGQAERGEPFQHVAVPIAVGRVQLVEMLRSPVSTSGRGERTRPRRSISGVRGRDRRMPPGSRPHGGTARPQPRRAPMAWPHRDTTTSRRAQRHHGDAVRTHPTPHHPKRQRPRPAAADPPDRADHPLSVPGRNRDPVARSRLLPGTAGGVVPAVRLRSVVDLDGRQDILSVMQLGEPARKHGVSDANILHAVRNSMR